MKSPCGLDISSRIGCLHNHNRITVRFAIDEPRLLAGFVLLGPALTFRDIFKALRLARRPLLSIHIGDSAPGFQTRRALLTHKV
jgi:hypothetical protein